ncbi:MAG: acetolactate synthase small subunit [Salinisphaeraceae bacterium]|nr:acetolactate synthase small subunit [Salinisphaeraceae bacterium]
MRHIISILMQNEAGALVRVAGMFSQRGFNIESLNVAPTEDETVSRLTLVTTGTEDVVNQINRQLLKLVDVIDVLDMTDGEHIERELMFFKLEARPDDPRQRSLLAEDHIEEIDRRDGIVSLQFFGTSVEVADLVARLAGSGELLEVMRSGALAITPGDRCLRYQAD